MKKLQQEEFIPPDGWTVKYFPKFVNLAILTNGKEERIYNIKYNKWN